MIFTKQATFINLCTNHAPRFYHKILGKMVWICYKNRKHRIPIMSTPTNNIIMQNNLITTFSASNLGQMFSLVSFIHVSQTTSLEDS